MARSSRLGEIIFGENLKASAAARSAHPNRRPARLTTRPCSTLAEKRVVSEWMDLGGQYYNNPAANGSPVRVARLSQTVFESDVFPILQSDCASCHQPNGNSGAAQTAQSFADNRFVLAGSVEGDYNVTLTMISDVCNGPSSALLRRPSTAPHPSARPGAQRRCRPAAPSTTPSPAGSPAAAGPNDEEAPCRDRCAAAAAALLASCGGGNPLSNPDSIQNPGQTTGQKLSFIYFQKCVNPIYSLQLQVNQNGSRPPTPAPAAAATTPTPAPAARCA